MWSQKKKSIGASQHSKKSMCVCVSVCVFIFNAHAQLSHQFFHNSAVGWLAGCCYCYDLLLYSSVDTIVRCHVAFSCHLRVGHLLSIIFHDAHHQTVHIVVEGKMIFSGT